MLSKVNEYNINYGTYAIQRYSKTNTFNIIQDNMNGYLLVKDGENVYLFDYYLNRKYNFNRIKLKFNNKYFFKQIESFDQNNVKEANNIRKSALNYFKEKEISNSIIGIGGEYYIYFNFLNYDNYYGLSNHKSIVEDATYNFKKSKNYMVDYNKLTNYPIFEKSCTYDVIINVINIHENIIKYICSYNIKNIVIITCVPLDKKIKMLNKYLKLKKITHIQNINSIISVCFFIKN
jgi:hypothetical protein